MNLDKLQDQCSAFVEERMASDPAHDISHVRRVVANAVQLSDTERARHEITLPAAWLPDCVSVPKNSGLRSQASRMAADEGGRFLASIGFPDVLREEVQHAIEAHSFSANIAPRTLEARVVQDADRLEALGAIGIARCLLTGGAMGTPLYANNDPFCRDREPDDRAYTLDHFYRKLLGLPGSMRTEAGRTEAERRVAYMHEFLRTLEQEISGHHQFLDRLE